MSTRTKLWLLSARRVDWRRFLQTTRMNDVVGMARAEFTWPLPFATSCCGIEFMATMASHYDLVWFGKELISHHVKLTC
jgi:NADH:ubiquinone oxidoreductase subunit B-like Fe-S oxidoreductase